MTALAIALTIAATGLPVFPCAPDKRPAISKAEGGRGFHDASRDPAVIRSMFNRYNAALIGVPTGEASGFDVLDFDYRHGAATWEQANKYRLPETRAHETKSGGRHMLFRHAPGVANSAGKVVPGVDVRGEGGYIIMPPSPGYRVICDADMAHWPDWLLPLVLPAPRNLAAPRGSAPCTRISNERSKAIVETILARVRSAPDGGKHFTLRNAALQLGGIADQAGISDREAIQRLLGALTGSVRDWRGAEATAAWGLEHGRARPIDIPDKPDKTPEPRRKETAALAFRLLRMGVTTDKIVFTLHEQNRRRLDPLPADVVTDTVLWAAHQLLERRHAG